MTYTDILYYPHYIGNLIFTGEATIKLKRFMSLNKGMYYVVFYRGYKFGNYFTSSQIHNSIGTLGIF